MSPETLPDGFVCNFPYSLETELFGRRPECRLLHEWFQAGTVQPALLISGLEGMGKSALAWSWSLELVQRQPAVTVFWWQLERGSRAFSGLIAGLLRHLGEEPRRFAALPQAVDRVLFQLQQQTLLLVLDDADDLCSAAAGKQSPVATFFQHLTNPDQTTTRLLLIVRQEGAAEGLGEAAGIRTLRLAPLAPADVYHYFCHLGLHTSLERIIELGEPLHYHPFSLRLLAGYALESSGPENSLALLPRIEWEHLLPWAFGQLPASAQLILTHIALSSRPLAEEHLRRQLPTPSLLGDLLRLQRRGFLNQVTSQRQSYYTVHALVRRYVRQQAARQTPATWRPLLLIPSPQPPSPPDAGPSPPPDVPTAVAEYRRLVGQGQNDQALGLFRQHLVGWIDPDGQSHQVEIELLRALFAGGQENLPRLANPLDMAWVLDHLAGCLTLTGQPALAVARLEQSQAIYLRLGEKSLLAAVLTQSAQNQTEMGNLAAADQQLRRGLALYQELDDPVGEATVRLHLGYLLAIRGQRAEVARQLNQALELAQTTAHLLLQSTVWAYGAWMALLQGDGPAGLQAAQEAWRLLSEMGSTSSLMDPSHVRLHWLLGWANILTGEQKMAKMHLDEALRRCRATHLVPFAPAILIARARLAQSHSRWPGSASPLLDSTGSLANQALGVARRAGYVLNMADAHLLLAELAQVEGDLVRMHYHAAEAHQYAECDGPPFNYALAQEKAIRLLGGEGLPGVPLVLGMR